jgi:hypothetical protein
MYLAYSSNVRTRDHSGITNGHSDCQYASILTSSIQRKIKLISNRLETSKTSQFLND